MVLFYYKQHYTIRYPYQSFLPIILSFKGSCKHAQRIVELERSNKHPHLRALVANSVPSTHPLVKQSLKTRSQCIFIGRNNNTQICSKSTSYPGSLSFSSLVERPWSPLVTCLCMGVAPHLTTVNARISARGAYLIF